MKILDFQVLDQQYFIRHYIACFASFCLTVSHNWNLPLHLDSWLFHQEGLTRVLLKIFMCICRIIFQKSLKYHTVDKRFKFLNHKILVFFSKSPQVLIHFLLFSEKNQIACISSELQVCWRREWISVKELFVVLFYSPFFISIILLLLYSWLESWSELEHLLAGFLVLIQLLLKVSGEITTSPKHQFAQS